MPGANISLLCMNQLKVANVCYRLNGKEFPQRNIFRRHNCTKVCHHAQEKANWRDVYWLLGCCALVTKVFLHTEARNYDASLKLKKT